MSDKSKTTERPSDKGGTGGKTGKSNGEFIRNHQPVVDHHPPPDSKPKNKK